MFHSAFNFLPNLNNIPFYPGYSYFCSVCKQRFQTEKNFNRHNNSRKHIKQMEIIRENHGRFLSFKSNANTMKLDLLPNEVIERLIADLTSQVDQKDAFFNEIQLVDDNQLDDMINSISVTQNSTQSKYSVGKGSIFNEPKRNKFGAIPPTYPCLTCFQSLDSQQNFDEHMLRAHFNVSIGFDRQF